MAFTFETLDTLWSLEINRLQKTLSIHSRWYGEIEYRNFKGTVYIKRLYSRSQYLYVFSPTIVCASHLIFISGQNPSLQASYRWLTGGRRDGLLHKLRGGTRGEPLAKLMAHGQLLKSTRYPRPTKIGRNLGQLPLDSAIGARKRFVSKE